MKGLRCSLIRIIILFLTIVTLAIAEAALALIK